MPNRPYICISLYLLNALPAARCQVSEFKVPAILREQQFVSLGFCVALDEAFEDESSGPAGQLAHRLWVYVQLAIRARRTYAFPFHCPIFVVSV